MKTIRHSVAVAALALGLGATSVARAGTTTANFQSDSNTTKRKLGSFTGTATYDDAAGLLTVSVTNTSAAGNAGAALTGVALNINGPATAVYHDGDDAATAGDEDAFDDARSRKGKHLVKAKPLGTFEAGTALNGKFGRASRQMAAQGISAGSSRTFTFDVSGAGAGMTVNDFLSGNVGIAAAFRGKKADKVGGVIVPTVPGSPPVLPGAGGNNGAPDSPVVIDLPEITPPGGVIVPPVIIVDTGNGNGGNIGGNTGGPAAVPLPPAVWSGLLGLGALACPRLKKKLRELL
jgi:hypothetical protein